ncbi:MAG: right-handed parallel beta-helix repeat-containing protein [Deltaproteobacteria bacterium]|nr:right-handed parallel beta-helix repeat-containing protein [Deltaproteobacteria bacterium]
MRVVMVTMLGLWLTGCGGGNSGTPDGAPADGSVDVDAAADGDAGEVDGAAVDGALEVDAAMMGDAALAGDAALGLDAAMADAQPADAQPADAQPADAQPADAAGCGALAADPTDVYVDRSATTTSVGTQACPFHSIREATLLTAPAGSRIIHVRGGTPAFVYSETGPIAVRAREHLQGDGETLTQVTGVARCSVFDCVVTLAATARLSGFTVTGAAVEIPTGADGAAVDHVTVTGSNNDGFYVRATAQLSNVTARANQRHGLDARTGTVTITDSHFDGNDDDGVHADRQVVIDFRRGSASNNTLLGIALQDSATVSSSRMHTLTDVVIERNLGFGIEVGSTASLRLRNTVMRQNEVGLVFTPSSATGNLLDLGTATAGGAGGNVFAGNVAGSRNLRSGLCIQQSGAAGSQVAEGDTWSVCPPSQRRITGPFCVSQNTYADVGYVQASGVTDAPPLAAPASCTVGP